MKEDSEFYKNLLEHLYDGVYFVDRDGKITYWNIAAEKLTGYKKSEVLGKRCSENILVHVDDPENTLFGAKFPLAETIANGLVREAEVSLLHKDGHYIPVLIRIAPIRDSEGNIIGAVEIFGDNSLNMTLKERVKDLQRMSLIDSLTDLANRRYLEMSLKSRFEEMMRYGGLPFGVLFVDIDNFKQVNDTYGHAIGDEVLKKVAQTLSKTMRPFDIAGRWGGEEFVIIVVNIDQAVLDKVAERCRIQIQRSSTKTEGGSIGVTVSIGAALARQDDTVKTLVNRADQLMYHSKISGRNYVTSENP